MSDIAGYISQITLPSGNTYEIKDAAARSMITNNGTFVVAWNGTTSPTVTDIPAGVKVVYSSTTYTGSLTASASTLKNFYLVKSPTEIGQDIYDEYVTVQGGTEQSPTYSWEKIGDTQIQLSSIITSVTLNQHTTNFVKSYSSPTTASVIGASSTLKMTQPTITVTPSYTYLSATASGGSVAINSANTVNAITGYASNTTANFLTSITVTKDQHMKQTSLKGVSGTTTVSKVSEGTSQTTLSGATSSDTSTDAWLKGWSISNETLTIGGVKPTTQTTTQINVVTAAVTVAVAAASSTTVATGVLATDGDGAIVVTNVTSSNTAALTGLGTPTTAAAVGTSATFTLTPSSVTIKEDSATADGRIKVANGISSTTAQNGSVTWNSKDAKTVLTGLGTATTAAALDTQTTVGTTHG